MSLAIKICGLTRPADAVAAAEAGATYGGVILAPDSPRTVTPVAVPGIFSGTSLRRCGVFINESPGRILELVAELGLGVVQLHGDESPETTARLRDSIGVKVWKAIRPRTGDEFAAEASRFGDAVDGLLLDGWSEKARGGTGTPFPWHEVAARRADLRPGVELIVAGGLTPANVAEVIVVLAPDVVDVSSGVESAPGVKDPITIREFADAVRGARLNGGHVDGSTVRV